MGQRASLHVFLSFKVDNSNSNREHVSCSEQCRLRAVCDDILPSEVDVGCLQDGSGPPDGQKMGVPLGKFSILFANVLYSHYQVKISKGFVL